MAGSEARRGEALIVLALAIIACFTNEALARLIAKQSPWPAIAGEIRTEIYLHDGVRRIQERWREPATGNGSEGGQNQNGGGGPPVYTEYTAREYVHSPGYVDEYVCEIDTDSAAGPSGAFWWVLQDANYNVVALISDGDGAGGGGPGSGGTTRGEVARQYAWSPYGQLLRADIYDTSAPMSRLGHQGLFHDRLDADILAEPMVAFARQAVQNRNRTLLTWLARFAQPDQNGTGATPAYHLSYLGQAPVSPYPHHVDWEALYGDGLSIYCYARSNPTGLNDPLGLFSMSELGATSAISGLIGGIVSGTVNKIFGGSFRDGFVAGAVAGAAGGAAGYAVYLFCLLRVSRWLDSRPNRRWSR